MLFVVTLNHGWLRLKLLAGAVGLWLKAVTRSLAKEWGMFPQRSISIPGISMYGILIRFTHVQVMYSKKMLANLPGICGIVEHIACFDTGQMGSMSLHWNLPCFQGVGARWNIARHSGVAEAATSWSHLRQETLHWYTSVDICRLLSLHITALWKPLETFVLSQNGSVRSLISLGWTPNAAE